MPQRLIRMQNDAAHFAIVTATAGWAWITAESLAIIVPCLWAIYALLLIAKTLPDVLEKHPWAVRLFLSVWFWTGRIAMRVFNKVRRGS